MNILRSLTPAAVARHFSHDTMLRARGYADGLEDRSVGDLTATTVTASAEVWGTDYRPYVVQLRASRYGDVLSIATTCTCPVHFQCKHGAALALDLGSMFSTPEELTWEDLDSANWSVTLSELATMVHAAPETSMATPSV